MPLKSIFLTQFCTIDILLKNNTRMLCFKFYFVYFNKFINSMKINHLLQWTDIFSVFNQGGGSVVDTFNEVKSEFVKKKS